MKVAVAVGVFILAGAAVGWYGLPVLIDRETAGLKQRGERIETFVPSEEKARKAAVLPLETEDRKKSIEELQATLRKARAEADATLSAALSRIDLLRHETSKLLLSIPRSER